MRSRFITILKRFIPPLVVILLFPIVVALLFLPESFLYIPPEGFSGTLRPIIFVGLFFFVVFTFAKRSSQNADPIAQKILFLILAPGIIGIGLYFIYGNPLLFLLGVAGCYLAGLWINVLRFPPRFWNVVRLVRKKKPVQALQLLNSWIQTHPDDWRAFQLRAGLHFTQLKIAEAEHDARTAIRLRPIAHHEDFAQLYHILHLQSLYTEAKQAILGALTLRADPAYYFNLGLECYRLEQYPEAIEALQKATGHTLSLMMGNLLANYYLGRSFEITGDRERASNCYNNLPKHSQNLKKYMEQVSQLPDYPEVIQMRADYADIDRRLSQQ